MRVFQAEFDVITQDFTRCEEQLLKLGNVNDMEKRKQELGVQLKAGKAKLISLNVSRECTELVVKGFFPYKGADTSVC